MSARRQLCQHDRTFCCCDEWVSKATPHECGGGHFLILTARAPCAYSVLAPLGDYPDLYLRTVYDILHMFRVRELEKLDVAAAEIARRKRAGGVVISAIGTPHIMYAGACGADVPGNPNIAPEPNVGFNTGDLSKHPQCNGKALGAGDVLLTANSSADVAQAHANGCYVVGIGFPMTTNRYSPPNYNDWPGKQNSALCCVVCPWGWSLEFAWKHS